jgi:hypothetical protein
MRKLGAMVVAFLFSGMALAQGVTSVLTPVDSDLNKESIQLKNDSFTDEGGQAYLQMGFIKGEMAGVWVQVPAGIKLFKVDYFRVLIGSNQTQKAKLQVFFQMAVAKTTSSAMGRDIENAAEITPGAYWNDIPAQGEGSSLRCATGGEFVGGAIEFTHDGAPSVYRDMDGINAKNNVLMAIPGGWNYSVAFGLRGDWILRVVGHEAKPEECGM